ncbi:MAG: ABC transporter substrate-binding protein [Spirochaetaceae bacterium]
MKVKTLTGFLLVAALAAVVLAGCGGEGAEAEIEKTVTIARGTDAETLDTGYAWSEAEIDIMYHMYEGLVRYADDELNVEPSLAESWEVSDDGTVWTFDLRDDVTFHDGTEFNAEAVVFSYKRLIDEDHPYHGLGDFSSFEYLFGDAVEDVRAVDDYTVEFTLADRFAPFLMYMGFYSQFIVSPSAVEEHGEDFFRNPVGTGPFEFREWQRDEEVVIEKYDDYWGEEPEIDSIVWKVVPEDSTRLLEIQAGEVDIIKNILPEQLETVEEDEELELVQVTGANLFFGSINHEVEPFDDVRVRRAVSHAIDFESLVDSVYGGLGTPAVNPMPDTVLGYNDDIEPYEYDPERARELLADAGYPDGFETEIHVFEEPRVYIGRPVDAAEILRDNLREVGIDADVIVNEWGTHFASMRDYEHSIGLIGWYDIGHPHNFLKVMLIDSALTQYADMDRLSELASSALTTYDEDEQVDYYGEMQEIIHEDAVLLNLAHSDYTAVIRDNVSGFELDSLGTANLLNVNIE